MLELMGSKKNPAEEFRWGSKKSCRNTNLLNFKHANLKLNPFRRVILTRSYFR